MFSKHLLICHHVPATISALGMNSVHLFPKQARELWVDILLVSWMRKMEAQDVHTGRG